MAGQRQSRQSGWRALVAAFGVAIAVAIISMTASTPAAAQPVQAVQPGNLCPAGYTIIPSGITLGYCSENSGNPLGLGCPSGYIPASLPGTFGPIPVCNISGFSPEVATALFAAKARLASLIAQLRAFGPWSETLPTTLEAEINDEKAIIKSETADLPVGLHLGMNVSPGPMNPIDTYGVGGAYTTRGSGIGVTDSAGLFAPGATLPSFKDTSGNGGITGTYAVSGLPVNQGLLFGGFFNYQRDNLSVGTFSGMPGDDGSAQTDTYTFGGLLHYNIGPTYLTGVATYNFGHGNETLNADGSTGSFNTHGYSADLKIGHIFVLLNTISSGSPSSSSMPTKAPPKPAGGYALGLDVSGHLGYSNQQLDGFTDSTGFIFGTGETRYEDVGARAKLFVVIPNNGYVWMPYVSGTVDREFGFSSTMNIPIQAALPSGDLTSLQEAQTFWGTALGVDVSGPNGWTVGVKGFYQASADINYTGGTAYVKIPLNYTPRPAFAARY
jgi:hypothetical protein